MRCFGICGRILVVKDGLVRATVLMLSGSCALATLLKVVERGVPAGLVGGDGQGLGGRYLAGRLLLAWLAVSGG